MMKVALSQISRDIRESPASKIKVFYATILSPNQQQDHRDRPDPLKPSENARPSLADVAVTHAD